MPEEFTKYLTRNWSGRNSRPLSGCNIHLANAVPDLAICAVHYLNHGQCWRPGFRPKLREVAVPDLPHLHNCCCCLEKGSFSTRHDQTISLRSCQFEQVAESGYRDKYCVLFRIFWTLLGPISVGLNLFSYAILRTKNVIFQYDMIALKDSLQMRKLGTLDREG